MHIKKVLIAILIFVLTIGISSAHENITDNIHVIENSQEIHSISENSFEDVQDIIEKAQNNSTIDLNGTYKGLGYEIKIDKDITIEGNNATLDGNHQSKIFNIVSGNVILKNIHFINGYSITNGGAIFSNGKLTLINCTFMNNTVESEYDWYFNTHKHNYELEEIGTGGAIYSTDELSVINSSFIYNSAICNLISREMDIYYVEDTGSASAIYCKGRLYLEKSNFSNNTKEVIIAYNDTEITECIFENQTQTFSNYENTYTKITNSKFKNCGLNEMYYDIYVGYSNTFINNCNFSNMKKILLSYRDCEIANSIFSDNSAQYSENNLISSFGDMKITNSTFKNNHARDTAIMELKIYEINNCTFINNSDATIFTGIDLLNDSLNKIQLFEVKLVNKLSKVYYSSGKIISVKLVNVKSNETNYYWGYDVYRNGRAFYDYGMGETMQFPVSTWKVGTYDIIILPPNSYTYPDSLTFTVTILKAPTIVKAPKITAKYKKSKYFKITVKNKVTKKVAKNLKIKVKVYTGKKYKIFNLKTNKNGQTKINTRSFKVGKHKVVISSGNTNYKVSANSQITIKQ